jgi:hypothetical protein
MMVLEYTLELKHKNKTARRMRLSKKSKEVKSPPIMNNNGWRFRLGDGGGGVHHIAPPTPLQTGNCRFIFL